MNQASAVLPSGIVRTGDLARIARTNVVIGGNLSELADAPVRTGTGPTLYLHDIRVVENGTGIITAYAHVNGRRTVYIPLTKRADASTIDVMNAVRKALPSTHDPLPTFLVGGGARTLKGGRHLVYPEHTPLINLQACGEARR